jgi:hypothetical protein
MAIPGYRWVRGLVPEQVYEHASRAKGARTWDDHLAAVLGSAHSAAAGTETVAPGLHLPQPSTLGRPAAPPLDLSASTAPTVVEVTTEPNNAPSVEPPTPLDRWRTADEIMRDQGHAEYQHGVLIGVGALLAGAASVSARGE